MVTDSDQGPRCLLLGLEFVDMVPLLKYAVSIKVKPFNSTARSGPTDSMNGSDQGWWKVA